jgi:hypothetical protein
MEPCNGDGEHLVAPTFATTCGIVSLEYTRVTCLLFIDCIWHNTLRSTRKGLRWSTLKRFDHGVNTYFSTISVKECMDTKSGSNYVGFTNEVKDGTPCQRWDATSPHNPEQSMKNISLFPRDRSFEEIGNSCRNPGDVESQVWCYTTKKNVRWAFCSVPYCLKRKPVYHWEFGWNWSLVANAMTALTAASNSQLWECPQSCTEKLNCGKTR